MKPRQTVAILLTLFAIMASIPFLVPGCGFVALFSLVPLLAAERVASLKGLKGFWWMQYLAFLVFNFITTFWIRNATFGGAVFAVVANAAQMSLVFEIFRFSKRYFKGTLPYIFLMCLWIAFEAHYYDVQISWPWLTLGNSFARSIRLVQWYEYTGVMGGTLWVWLCNLAIFGGMVALSDGSFALKWNNKARAAYFIGLVSVIFGPMIVSGVIWNRFQESSDPVKVIIGQPNFDPYQKFESLNQGQQNDIFMELVKPSLDADSLQNSLVIAPETFVGGIVLNRFDENASVVAFRDFLRSYPNSSLLLGASTYEYVEVGKAHSPVARETFGDNWYESYNSAIMLRPEGSEIYHKSKLVVGVEQTPFPKIFVPIDNSLGGVMGRCIGQKEASVLHFDGHKIGCAVCYESIYGEYCTEYVKKGADVLAVITNDAWWGNTAGYRQHLSYASLRAIETRRDIARCANTGISALINQRGEILEKTSWWQSEVLTGEINANSAITFFVSHGDIIGRIFTFLFFLLSLLLLVRILTTLRPRS
ncbi:MAG: apolipoprotein N-acyltransferase [Bacteroidaceae bacterium]|nr:apolipoprotein N-acyltransferase [Bacteroidales bacterium]MCF0185194.1 apolipoprotein N-acyltransferase [Bacteroidaceae bacterium]